MISTAINLKLTIAVESNPQCDVAIILPGDGGDLTMMITETIKLPDGSHHMNTMVRVKMSPEDAMSLSQGIAQKAIKALK